MADHEAITMLPMNSTNTNSAVFEHPATLKILYLMMMGIVAASWQLVPHERSQPAA